MDNNGKTKRMRNIFKDKKLVLHGMPRPVKIEAASRIGRVSTKIAINVLSPMLKNKDPSVRDAAAIGLSRSNDSAVVSLILEAIHDPINKDDLSTFAYALEKLDCSLILGEIIDLAISEQSFTELSARAILARESFFCSNNDIKRQRYKVDQFLKTKESPACHYSDLIRFLESLLLSSPVAD